MATFVISEDQKVELSEFLKTNPKAELVTVYLLYLENKFGIAPVVFPRNKIIYQSAADATRSLEKEDVVWRETQIKIGVGSQPVNESTQKIYICPFTGKVFGDNTRPNPQDAIYDWVSKCPENTERLDGLRVKRFFVSEDPQVIKGYMSQPKKTITKTVYSSALTGKLFHSKAATIKDFQKNYLKEIPLTEVQNQNRFEIEKNFLTFLQDQLEEEKITAFVEALAQIEEFLPFVEQWVDFEAEEEEEESEQTEGTPTVEA